MDIDQVPSDSTGMALQAAPAGGGGGTPWMQVGLESPPHRLKVPQAWCAPAGEGV